MTFQAPRAHYCQVSIVLLYSPTIHREAEMELSHTIASHSLIHIRKKSGTFVCSRRMYRNQPEWINQFEIVRSVCWILLFIYHRVCRLLLNNNNNRRRKKKKTKGLCAKEWCRESRRSVSVQLQWKQLQVRNCCCEAFKSGLRADYGGVIQIVFYVQCVVASCFWFFYKHLN